MDKYQLHTNRYWIRTQFWMCRMARTYALVFGLLRVLDWKPSHSQCPPVRSIQPSYPGVLGTNHANHQQPPATGNSTQCPLLQAAWYPQSRSPTANEREGKWWGWSEVPGKVRGADAVIWNSKQQYPAGEGRTHTRIWRGENKHYPPPFLFF